MRGVVNSNRYIDNPITVFGRKKNYVRANVVYFQPVNVVVGTDACKQLGLINSKLGYLHFHAIL